MSCKNEWLPVNNKGVFAIILVLGFLSCCHCTDDLPARLQLRMERRARAKARRPSLRLDVPPETAVKAHPITSDNFSPADWAPLVINSTCSAGMSASWAPCIKGTVNRAAEEAGRPARITYAEELIFPDFQAHVPLFVKDADKAYWLQKVSEEVGRASVNGDFLTYKGQHGQNLVFSNAAYKGLPASDAWMANSCLNPEVSHRAFGTEAEEEGNAEVATAAVDSSSGGMDFPSISIAAAPDSWSFQHFHDRVTHIILQGQHLTHTDTTYITGREPDSPFVKALWNKLVPDAKQRVLHTQQQHWPIRAKELIFSCRAPLVHPWFAQRLAEEAGVMGFQKPWAERKVILYCSRSRDGVMHNGGRSVTNEPAVITALETLLTVRAEDEQLEVFDLSQWGNDFDGMVKFFASNVRAVIGPHGGALVNVNWAARVTGVVEIMPSKLFSVAIYELASTLGQRYGFMQSPSVNDQNDMTVDIPELMGIVSAVLSNDAGSDALQPSYMWNTNAHKL